MLKYNFKKFILSLLDINNQDTDLILKYDPESVKEWERLLVAQQTPQVLRQRQRLLYLSMIRALMAECSPAIDWQNISLDYHPSGQPYLTYCKNPREGGGELLPLISITHSENWIGIAISKTKFPIGIDLEVIDGKKRPSVNAIAETYFSPLESQFVRHHGLLSFLRLWTAKEAFAKCHSEGLDTALKIDIGKEVSENFDEKNAVSIEAPEVHFSLHSSHQLTQLIIQKTLVCSIVCF